MTTGTLSERTKPDYHMAAAIDFMRRQCPEAADFHIELGARRIAAHLARVWTAWEHAEADRGRVA